MDFSRVSCPTTIRRFLDEARDFLRTHVTEEVIRRDRETGDNFDEGVHLALGAAGYLEREWKPESEGGFTRRAPPHLGTREAARPRAVGDVGYDRHDRAFGGEVRLAGTER